jgi:hypothetical protein
MASFFKNLFQVPVPPRPPVPPAKTRICVSGYGISHNTGQAQKLAAVIAKEHPDKYETWFYFSTFSFKDFLTTLKQEIPEDQQSKLSTLDSNTKTVSQHTSAPFVWLERGDNNKMEAIGGRDKFCDWATKEFPGEEPIQALSSVEEPPLSELFFDNTTPGGTWMES